MALDPAARATLEIVAEKWRAWIAEHGTRHGVDYAQELLRIIGTEKESGRISPDEAIELFFAVGEFVDGSTPTLQWPG